MEWKVRGAVDDPNYYSWGNWRRKRQEEIRWASLDIENRWVAGLWPDQKGLGRGLLMGFGWKNPRKYRHLPHNGRSPFQQTEVLHKIIKQGPISYYFK